MKLTIVLLTAFFLQVHASGVSQTITLSGRDLPFKKVLEAIRTQTGYGVFSNASLLATAKPITLTVYDMPLVAFLELVMKGQSVTYQLKGETVMVTEKVKVTKDSLELYSGLLPFLTITGVVKDQDGKPLVGATIGIRGKSVLVVTDDQGVFSLTANEGDILAISFIAFKTREYKVLKTEYVDIVLQRNEIMMDTSVIVNTGYQQISKERAAGSFVVIDQETLNQQVGTNILKRLDGVTSGLLFNIGKLNSNPQNTTNITIRGLSTIEGPLDPLIVLDGFIYEGDINNINPNDIDNITVLKDASATSIWGARAGNGVIVISTKKGKFGQKLQMTASAGALVTEEPDLYRLPQMSSEDYLDVEEFLFNKGYFDAAINSDPTRRRTPAVEIFLKKRMGQISADDSSRQINLLRATDTRNEYLRYFYTPAITQQYSLNIRGGSDKNTYVFSAGYDKNLGETYSHSNKLNVMVQNSFRPLRNLQLDVAAYYTNSKSSPGRGEIYGGLKPDRRSVPYLRFTDEEGNALPVGTYQNDQFLDTLGAGKLLDWKYYPLDNYKYNHVSTNTNEIYSRLGLQYKLTKILRLDIKYQYQQQRTLTEILNDLESYRARDIINAYTQLNRETGALKYIVPMGGIKQEENTGISSNTWRGQLDLDHRKGVHQISAIAGAEVRESRSFGSGHTLYGYQEDPLLYSVVDFVNEYPYFSGGYGRSAEDPPYEYKKSTNRFVSIYGNAAYTYKDRYTLSGSVRRDGSNIFGLSTNDKWKPLWSAGLAWKMSDESFYPFTWLPRANIRITYGYSGNVDLSRTAEAVGVYTSGSNLTGLPYARIQRLNNPNLKWEQVNMLNIGIDLASLNNIITGSIEYYHKRGSDLYGSAPYDYTGWGRSKTVVMNVAGMVGNGIDINLTSRNINRKFTWNTTWLFSYNQSKTTRYETAEAKEILAVMGGGNYIKPLIGKPLYAIAFYKWGGLDASGNPQGYVNGQKSTDYSAIFQEAIDKGLDGNISYVNTSPVIFGSVINTFSFHGISLTTNFSYRAGYYFQKSVFSSIGLVENGSGHSDYAGRWKKAGDEAHTSIPSFAYPTIDGRDNFYASSEVAIRKGDHIRFQYINLAYTFQNRKRSSGSNGTLQLYVNASNLGIIWSANKEGIDPDYSSSVRPAKTWAAGIRANF